LKHGFEDGGLLEICKVEPCFRCRPSREARGRCIYIRFFQATLITGA
jgi:hypothetical protein